MPERIVTTRAGLLRGADEGDLHVFKGVGYARVGLRFAPPLPVDPWSGIRDATAFGPVAPQPPPDPSTGVPGDPDEWDEDCLNLNIWAPAAPADSAATGSPADPATTGAADAAGRLRPVMVWVHGGGFVGGAGSGQLYRGEHLARRGDVVVVTINYRLGAFGFLSHPTLAMPGTPGHGNWGLLDVVAALRWIRENIAAFGGDPQNVTLFGESAGSISVCCLLGAPAARGLFRRAIAQSGPAVARSSRSAAAIAERVASQLGLAGVDPVAMRSVPAGELLAAQAAAVGGFAGDDGLAFQPVVDGGLLERHPADAIAAGHASGVDLLIGTNRDEFKFFALAMPELAVIDDADLHRRVGKSMHAAGVGHQVPAQAIVEGYSSARAARGAAAGALELFSAMASDWLFRIPSIRLAEVQAAHNPRTYMYLFDWESPFAGGVLGSCHALELPFVFGTHLHPAISMFSGTGPEVAALSETIEDAWAAFARSSDPSTPGLRWPPYEATRRQTMRLGVMRAVVDAPLDAERAVWDPYLGRYGQGGPVEGAGEFLGIPEAVAGE